MDAREFADKIFKRFALMKARKIYERALRSPRMLRFLSCAGWRKSLDLFMTERMAATTFFDIEENGLVLEQDDDA